LVGLPQNHEQKSRQNSQNGRISKTGDIFPNKVTTSLQLIRMGTVTAKKNLTPPHAWEPRFDKMGPFEGLLSANS